jgi:hypothetical protein
MTRAANTEGIEKATGKPWSEWLAYLDGIKASELTHAEIAQKVHEHGSPGWWAQTITVAYEQHIGRRTPGQTSNGKFQVGASKTIDSTMDEALERWVAVVKDYKKFDGVAVAREPLTSKKDKFRYWHCGLADGSRVSMSIYEKEPGKSVIGLGHENLESQADIERWRGFWKSLLAKV